MNRLTKVADKIGSHGKAWRGDIDAVTSGPHSLICHWIIEADWAHPLWHSYLLGCIHLRPVVGMQAPVIFLPGATHEVFLYALNPAVTPKTDEPNSFLIPPNFLGQWIEQSDEAAAAKIEGHVDEILRGALSPDTDFIKMWIERFSDSNLKIDKAYVELEMDQPRLVTPIVGSSGALH